LVFAANVLDVEQQRNANYLARFVDPHHQRVVEVETDLVFSESLGSLIHVLTKNVNQSFQSASNDGSYSSIYSVSPFAMSSVFPFVYGPI